MVPLMQNPEQRARVDFQSPLLPADGLWFDGFDEVVEAHSLADVRPALERVERLVRDGMHAVGFLAYEAAPAFDALQVHEASPLPLLWFGVARTVRVEALPTAGDAISTSFAPVWNQGDYNRAFAIAQDHIHDGNTYQINLTFPMRCRRPIDPVAWYSQLKQAQSANYSGMIQTPGFSIVSASPELFFEKTGARIRTKPMKGTRRRAPLLNDDRQLADELRNSTKDRAENVMIVDLLRNDLGRIADPGGVTVPRLFDVEKYPTVWQMTSTVEATLRDDVGLCDVFSAIFPCGSVTGAPKVKTMEIIKTLEPEPRGVYCGAFGVILPRGDCVFNVPIRTASLIGQDITYSVGSGVVADSNPEHEYHECLLKANVLNAALPEFQLLETILWKLHGGFFVLDHHLERLAESAAYFDFTVDIAATRTELQRAAEGWTEDKRIRLLVHRDGCFELEAAPLTAFSKAIRTVKLADAAVDRHNPFLYHKTTHRAVYNAERARLGAADDVILFNECGELTESTIANLAVKLDGRWYTPPVHCGLLNGTLRRRMVADGDLVERVIRIEELKRAEGLRLLNSVRGCFDVLLVRQPPGQK